LKSPQRNYANLKLFEGKNADIYRDISVAKIRRMEEFGAPKGLVDRLAYERSQYALKEISEKSNELKRIAFQIRDGNVDRLTDIEAQKLWDEAKDLGLDATESAGKPNQLLKRLADDAINSKDPKRMQKLADEMKAKKTECEIKGECPSTGGAAASGGKLLGAATLVGGGALISTGAIIGTTTTADGKTYITTMGSKVYNEITPTGPKTVQPEYAERKSEYGPENVNKNIVRAYDVYMNSHLPNVTYSEGNQPGIQGNKIDAEERICQTFAMKGADFINDRKELKSLGLQAKVVNVYGTYLTGENTGKTISHALVLIENTNNPIGTYIDPVTKETKTIYESTLLEPQTGQTGESGRDLTGTTMMLGNSKYKIEYTQEMEKATQQTWMQYDLGYNAPVTAAPKGTEVISNVLDGETPGLNESIESAKKLGANESTLKIGNIDAWWTQGADAKIINKEVN
jgi:hypothetical protein